MDVSDFSIIISLQEIISPLAEAAGDDSSRINIYNQDAVYGLAAYQKLSQFFSIDAATSSYDQVVQDFLMESWFIRSRPPIFWIGLRRRRRTEALRGNTA